MKWNSGGGVSQLPKQQTEPLPVGVQLGNNVLEFTENGWEVKNDKEESDDRYCAENKRLSEEVVRMQAGLDLIRCQLMKGVQESNGVKFQNQLLLDLLAVARVDKRQSENLLKRSMGYRMGSEISKAYAVDEAPTGTAGLSGMWKLHKGIHRETGEAVTVWIFHPTDALSGLKNKAVKGVLLDCMRRDITNMKVMKHPKIPEVIEAYDVGEKKTASFLTTASSKMAMVTKPVVCSLADILKNWGPTNLSAQEDYEIARGLCGIAEALQYVHTVCKKIHLSLSPECIVLTQTGVWKLAGFGFSTEIGLPCPYFRSQGVKNSELVKVHGPWRTQPPLAYSSPEATSSGDISTCSDLFSLGILMYQFLAPGGPNSPGASLLKLRDDNRATIQAHQLACSNAQGLVLHSPTQALIQSLVGVNPNARTPLVQLAAHPLFHTPQVMTLKTIDSLSHMNPQEAGSALSAIREPISLFPLRLQCKCILPILLDSAREYQNGKLWHSVLPLVGDILGKMDSKDIAENGKRGIQWKLISATNREEPETLCHIINLIPLFVEKCSKNFIQESIIPAVCRSIAKEGYPRLQQAALEAASLSSFASVIMAESLERDILPRVCWLVVKSKDINMRTNALISLSKFFHYLPLKCILEKVLSTLKFAVHHDKTVGVQLCCLKTYEEIAKRMPESTAVITDILPSIVPILANKSLTFEQYDMVVGKVRTLLDNAIERQRDARSCNLKTKNSKQNTSKSFSSRDSSKELTSNLQVTRGSPPFSATSTNMMVAASNSSLKESEPLSSDVYNLSLSQRSGDKPSPPLNAFLSSAFDMQRGPPNTNTGTLSLINDQEMEKVTTASLPTSSNLGSDFEFSSTVSSTTRTGVVHTKRRTAEMASDTTAIGLEKDTAIKIGNGNPIQSFQPFDYSNTTQNFQSAFGSAASSGGTGATTTNGTAPVPQQPGSLENGMFPFPSMTISNTPKSSGQATMINNIGSDEALFPKLEPPPQYCHQNQNQQLLHLNTTVAESEDPFAFLIPPDSR